MPITFTKEKDSVALVTMDFGENRFNPEFTGSLLAVLDAIEADNSYKAVVLCSKDEKFWSLGVDVEWTGKAAKEGRLQEIRDFLYSANALFKRIMTYPMPVIAAIGGHAFGDGAVLALSCDFRYMKSGRVSFCFPEVDINIPFLPSNQEIVTKVVPGWFMEDMILTGRRIDAAELEKHHIIRKGCDSEESLIKESVEFASTFAKSRGIFAEHKKRLNKRIFKLMDNEDKTFIEPLNLSV